MASSSRVALIVGAGSNVGASLVKSFLTAGYHVATVSRSGSTDDNNNNNGNGNGKYHTIRADVSDPSAIPGIFADLAGARPDWPFPSVVVWNAAGATPPPATDAANPLAVPAAALGRDLDLMVRSPYLAAQTAVEGWRTAAGGTGPGRKGTFIMTGNMLPRKVLPVPAMVTLGVGKNGGSFWVGLADAVFKDEGMRFFYADERSADGGPSIPPKGESHAKLYLRLTEDEEVPSYVTFVDGEYREIFP